MKKAVVIRMPLEIVRDIASSTVVTIGIVDRSSFYIVLTRTFDVPLGALNAFFFNTRWNRNFHAGTLKNVATKTRRTLS